MAANPPRMPMDPHRLDLVLHNWRTSTRLCGKHGLKLVVEPQSEVVGSLVGLIRLEERSREEVDVARQHRDVSGRAPDDGHRWRTPHVSRAADAWAEGSSRDAIDAVAETFP